MNNETSPVVSKLPHITLIPRYFIFDVGFDKGRYQFTGSCQPKFDQKTSISDITQRVKMIDAAKCFFFLFWGGRIDGEMKSRHFLPNGQVFDSNCKHPPRQQS